MKINSAASEMEHASTTYLCKPQFRAKYINHDNRCRSVFLALHSIFLDHSALYSSACLRIFTDEIQICVHNASLREERKFLTKLSLGGGGGGGNNFTLRSHDKQGRSEPR